jgi:microcystin-dependent protein
MAWTNPRTWVTSELVTAAEMNTHIRDNLNAMFPIGSLLLRAANYTTVETAVEGRWLQCNGVAVSRTTYADLFAYLNGLTPALPFGTGDGSTTFNLPDMRGRVPVAEGEHTDVDEMGDSDGKAIANRSSKHFHQSQFGANSVGGTIPVPNSLDSVITRTFPTSPGTSVSYSALPQDTPAFLVVGSYFIKYIT